MLKRGLKHVEKRTKRIHSRKENAAKRTHLTLASTEKLFVKYIITSEKSNIS